MLQHWWVWAVLAAILAAIEALAPGWVFLGLALGALGPTAVAGACLMLVRF